MPPPADKRGADGGSVVTASDNGDAQKGGASDENNGSKAKSPVVDSNVGDPQADAIRRSFVGKRGLRASLRSTSLVLRKEPSHNLLGHEEHSETERSNFSFERQGDDGDPPRELRFGGWLLRKTCLRPNFHLRIQMMLSFGVVSTLTLCIVMATTIALSVFTGHSVRISCRKPLTDWLEDNTATTRYVAEAFAPKLPYSLADALHVIVRDRFEGYPDAQGYKDDSLVPFYDVTTKRHRYPLEMPMLPMDWQLDPNVDAWNADEHLQGRGHWFPGFEVSTASSFYGVQGTCNPEETNVNAAAYYPNCTDAHNDMTKGVRK